MNKEKLALIQKLGFQQKPTSTIWASTLFFSVVLSEMEIDMQSLDQLKEVICQRLDSVIWSAEQLKDEVRSGCVTSVQKITPSYSEEH